jgi:hypothetical protein
LVQQLDVATRQLLAELLERRVATQRLADGVSRDREAGAANILLGQVGQNSLKFGAPLRITARNCPPGRADLPDTEQPDPVETLFREAVERGVVNVGEGDPFAGFARQPLKPHPRVDLKECWIPDRSRHRACSLRSLFLESDRGRPAANPMLGIDLAKKIDKGGDATGPPGLMTGADAGTVVAVEVLVKQQIVPPVGVVSKFFGPSEDRSTAGFVAQKDAGQPTGDFAGNLEQVHQVT